MGIEAYLAGQAIPLALEVLAITHLSGKRAWKALAGDVALLAAGVLFMLWQVHRAVRDASSGRRHARSASPICTTVMAPSTRCVPHARHQHGVDEANQWSKEPRGAVTPACFSAHRYASAWP